MKRVDRISFMDFSLLLAFLFFSDKSSNAEFTYQDVDSWPRIFPECGGQRQSPIAYTFDDIIEEDPDDYLTEVNYGKKPLRAKLLNDGHTLKVLFEWNENERPFFTGGILGDNEYVLDSMNFHWSSISPNSGEHCIINDCGTMELQLIHFNRNYGSFENSLNFTDGLVIYTIGFGYSRYEVQLKSPIRDIINNNVKSVGIPGSSVYIEPFVISDMREDQWDSVAYQAYLGSLTTPPCTENVLWLITTEALYLPKQEIDFLTSTIELYHGDKTNVRPVQPLNGRTLTMVWGFGDVVI